VWLSLSSLFPIKNESYDDARRKVVESRAKTKPASRGTGIAWPRKYRVRVCRLIVKICARTEFASKDEIRLREGEHLGRGARAHVNLFWKPIHALHPLVHELD
jgi:hypothetical protein